MLKELIENIKDKNIYDFYTVGYVDDETHQYYSDLHYLYLQIGSKFIEFESIEQNSKICIRIVERIINKLPIDEDDYKCISSIGEIILVSTELINNKIKEIVFYGLIEKDNYLICDGVELIIAEQMIFLDPGFLHGIGIGEKAQKKYWEENFKERIFPYIGKMPEKTSINLTNLI